MERQSQIPTNSCQLAMGFRPETKLPQSCTSSASRDTCMPADLPARQLWPI